MTINLVTLGCSKNLVDSEKLLHQLQKNGHEIQHNSNEYTDIVIVNTCGFILDAKTESIESILSFLEAKKQGFIDKIIVMGCLSERYKSDLQNEMPDVDGIFGVDDHAEILASIEARYYEGELYKRSLQTAPHYAYLKISEGCNRNCAFCAIPGIRGKQKSISIPDLIKEANELAKKGVKEILLIAQELTSYGTDIYGRKALTELLEELVKIESIEWIRFHYIYPSGFPADEMINLMKKHRKICRYLDIPVQHISDKILKSMNRNHGSAEVYEIIDKFRAALPDVVVRTTLISGFPGETEDDFIALKSFIQEIKFDRLGVFTYSHEEDTPAYKLEDNISFEVKTQRMEELLSIQESISLDNNQKRVGNNYKVIIDELEGEFYVGRTEFDSPEVDNEVLISAKTIKLRIGEFYDIEIFDATEFDLYGRIG